ncbi:hypothetical protein ACFY2M_18130 [Streptomyces sp. NPDC001276]|uniref:hypothetical protein n=1 Tax=Streptomyces sp. NPDC001276 TaxID=3364555 RepID=UPI0036CE4F58
MDAPDIVVPVRERAVSQELRYALRSWEAHLPHRRVWIIGYRPQWLGGVEYVPSQQAGRTKYANTTAAMRHACRRPEISDPFLWANDDFFFVMEKLDAMPVLHRGPVREIEEHYAARAAGGVDVLAVALQDIDQGKRHANATPVRDQRLRQP